MQNIISHECRRAIVQSICLADPIKGIQTLQLGSTKHRKVMLPKSDHFKVMQGSRGDYACFLKTLSSLDIRSMEVSSPLPRLDHIIEE